MEKVGREVAPYSLISEPVEAIQVLVGNLDRVEEFLRLVTKGKRTIEKVDRFREKIYISTDSNCPHIAEFTDWIVINVDGEPSVTSNRVFQRCYVPVERYDDGLTWGWTVKKEVGDD